MRLLSGAWHPGGPLADVSQGERDQLHLHPRLLLRQERHIQHRRQEDSISRQGCRKRQWSVDSLPLNFLMNLSHITFYIVYDFKTK